MLNKRWLKIVSVAAMFLFAAQTSFAFSTNEFLRPEAANQAPTGKAIEQELKKGEAALNFANVAELRKALEGIVDISGFRFPVVIDSNKLKESLIDKLVYDATFNPDKEVVTLTRGLIDYIAVA